MKKAVGLKVYEAKVRQDARALSFGIPDTDENLRMIAARHGLDFDAMRKARDRMRAEEDRDAAMADMDRLN